jgi:glucose/mannose transport system substrate-binding protein
VWYFNLFNSMLATSAGGKAFEAIYRDRDKEVLKSPEVVLAAERMGKLRDYVDAGSPGRNWNDATALVINGQAAFHLNGDWAKGEFIAAGKKPGTDYGCYIGFDGAPLIYGGNAFGFLKSDNPLTIAGQELLAKVAMDPVVQVNFAKFKGSMPVRTDADISSLDMCAQTAHTYMSDPAKSVIQSESLVTAQEVGELRDLMADYFSDPSMTPEDMLAAFADII